MIDLVYIVKETENNEDLRYSLRSVSKFIPYNKIWIVGYKPSWVINVEYIPVKQDCGNKWKNSVKNIIEACKCNKITDNFVLMNDDFFAIKLVENLEESVNLSLGDLEAESKKYKIKKINSNWTRAFSQVYELLDSLNIEKPYYSYESHTPLLLNKQKYLEIMNLPEVIEFMKTSKVLHKRTLYKNIIKPQNQIILSTDVKISEHKDNTLEKIKICDWISVFDYQVGNKNFPQLNKLLNELFPDQCKYEVPLPKPIILPNSNIKKTKNYYLF